MAGGWIKLHRALTAHWLWAEKPFDKKSAWIDLLLMANHRPGKVLFGSELLELDVGEHTLGEVDAMVAGKIRTTDILGLTFDGKLQIILPQASHDDLQHILPRFEGVDIQIRILR